MLSEDVKQVVYNFHINFISIQIHHMKKKVINFFICAAHRREIPPVQLEVKWGIVNSTISVGVYICIFLLITYFFKTNTTIALKQIENRKEKFLAFF